MLKKISIISLLLTLVVLSGCIFLPGPGCTIEDFSFGFQNTKIDLSSLLDQDSKENLTNDTFTLLISVPKTNREVYGHFIVNNRSNIVLNNTDGAILVNQPKYNTEYVVYIKIIINSSDPDIKNLNLIGINNSFPVILKRVKYNEYNDEFRLSIDPKYYEVVSVEDHYKVRSGDLMLVFGAGGVCAD